MEEIVTGNYRLLKDLNSNIILNLVRTNAPISGSELAKITGMRPSTVQNILKNLEITGIVLKIGTGDSTKLGGRRPTLWRIRGSYGYVIGVEVEINDIEVVLVDLNSKIIDDQHIIIEQFSTLSEMENIVTETIENMLRANNISKQSLLGIGIGVSGLVDITNGSIVKTSLLAPELQPINLQKSLDKYFDVPIYIENDANAAVMAEKWFGNVNGIANMIYTIIVVSSNGFGVGFGLILNNEVYRGSNMFAGETDLFASNIEKILKDHCDYKEDSFVVAGKKIKLDELQLHHLIDSLEYQNDCAIRFFCEIGKIVGNELIKVINMLDPEVIVLGGEIINANNYILDPIRQTVKEKISTVEHRKTQIVESSLSYSSVALGAATIILKKIFQDPLIDNVRQKKTI